MASSLIWQHLGADKIPYLALIGFALALTMFQCVPKLSASGATIDQKDFFGIIQDNFIKQIHADINRTCNDESVHYKLLFHFVAVLVEKRRTQPDIHRHSVIFVFANGKHRLAFELKNRKINRRKKSFLHLNDSNIPYYGGIFSHV